MTDQNVFLRIADRVATLPFPLPHVVFAATLIPWGFLLEMVRGMETAENGIALLIVAYVVVGGFFLMWRTWLARFEREETGSRHG